MDTREKVKVNLGCGKDLREGWTNVDREAQPHGVGDGFIQGDVMLLDRVLEPESVDEFLVSHLLEHLPDSLGFMAGLYAVAKPDAICVIRVPHGASDDAWEDPTHVRPYYPGSFGYFGQPFYWKADYGYRADWVVEVIELVVSRAVSLDELRWKRNVVLEMIVRLRAQKPPRACERELQETPDVRLVLAR